MKREVGGQRQLDAERPPEAPGLEDADRPGPAIDITSTREQSPMMVRVAAHRIGQRDGDALQPLPIGTSAADALDQRAARSLNTTAAATAQPANASGEPGDQSARVDGRRREGQRDGADEHHRQHAEHAVHQDRRRRFRQMHVVARKRVGAIHVGRHAGDEVADERADEEDAQHARGTAAAIPASARRADRSSAAPSACDRRAPARPRGEPAQVGAGRRARTTSAGWAL